MIAATLLLVALNTVGLVWLLLAYGTYAQRMQDRVDSYAAALLATKNESKAANLVAPEDKKKATPPDGRTRLRRVGLTPR